MKRALSVLSVCLAMPLLALTPHDLMCGLLAKPGWVAVTDPSPQFSWGFKGGRQGDYQTAYRIQVATSTSFLRADAPDLWDSGKVVSGQSLFITYEGNPLPTNATICWRVCVWDSRGRQGAWSQNVSFMTATALDGDRALRYPLTQTSVKPIRVVTNKEGHAFVDFGRAAFGWIDLIPQNNKPYIGPFILHVGEKAKGDTVDTAPGGARYAETRGSLTLPNVYRVPFTADAQNTSGDAATLPPEVGVVMPFRYVEVEECPFPVTTDAIRQIAVHYPFDDKAAAFVSNDRILDRVYAFSKYSIKATTFAGIYVDGDRERIPNAASAYINQLGHYALDREFTLARYTHEHLMATPALHTEWEQHSIMMAWADWMYTGNTQSLARCYDDLKNHKLLLGHARRTDGLLVTGGADGTHDLIDLPASERDGFDHKPVNAVVNAFYCLNVRQMADIAEALGNEKDAQSFRKLAEIVTASYNKAFYDAANGRYVDGQGSRHSSLHANMFPLAFGLVPETERASVAAYVRSRGMACSVYGAQYLLEALFEAGMDDEAIHLLTSTGERSWVNMMREGSTLSTETWGQNIKPDHGWNHPWGAAPANIIPRYVLGVRPLTAGFGKALIRPQVSNLEVHGIVPTIRGQVTVAVRQVPDRSYRLTVEIPVNMTARIELPSLPVRANELTLNGKPAPAIFENGRLIFDNIPSGKHTVQWRRR